MNGERDISKLLASRLYGIYKIQKGGFQVIGSYDLDDDSKTSDTSKKKSLKCGEATLKLFLCKLCPESQNR